MQEKYDYYDTGSLLSVFRHYVKKEGVMKTGKRIFIFISDIFVSKLLFFKKKRFFIFNNKSLPYLYAAYNKAWKNERTIEIPLFRELLAQAKGTSVLELGNVLHHYGSITHTVVDKYEQAQGVINEDILTFIPRKKYDRILSISTVEHIGVDDRPQNPEKALIALRKMQKLLTPKGKIIFSFPANYNPALMKLVKEKQKVYAFQRYDKKKNLWKQCNKEEIMTSTGSPPESIFLLELTAQETV